MSLVLPIAANRRGACPTLDTPMQTGDGLLARLRVAGGRLTPAQLTAIATLAAEHGNGLVEITARGNLQVRGLTLDSSEPFAQAVHALAAIESALVVETPPLAGDDPTEFTDPRALAAAIRAAAEPLVAHLGPKVTVIVDGQGQLTLAALKADIRLVASARNRWTISIAGRRAEPIITDDVVSVVLRVLGRLAELGPEARATDLPGPAAGQAQPTVEPLGNFNLRQGTATGIALPFGSGDHAMLTALATAAMRCGITQFRLAPHHALLAIGATGAFVAEAAALGFITSADDPRVRISACIGSDGCASGLIPARAVAARLAPSLASNVTLHVSGCCKGCAHPRRADVTLVGKPDGYGLVISGRAGDTPRALLRADELETAVAACQG
jgi:precorrin-3B synthase